MSKKNTAPTREAWLSEAMDRLVDVIEMAGVTVPRSKLAASCGIPQGKSSYIGQCWSESATEDGTAHLFVCPTVGGETIEQKVQLLGILLHEMIHATVGVVHKHQGEFRRVARAVGLKGKLTATTVAEGSDLHVELTLHAKKLGDYPHSRMLRKRAAATRPPAGAWIKFVSTTEDDYILRLSPKSFEEHGAPLDPWSQEMVADNRDSRKGA